LYDLIIYGGTIIDGTGASRRAGEVGVSGGRIASIGDLTGAETARRLDASGLIVAPGFIDIHSHSDLYLLVNPRAESKVRQGVTTELVGQCGMSPYPVQPEGVGDLRSAMAYIDAEFDWTWRTAAEYFEVLEARRPSVNVASLTGHIALRSHVMGFEGRPATPDELARMGDQLRACLEQGSVGLSYGLIYTPSCFADAEEMTALARVVAQYDGLCTVHMRNENEMLLQSIREMLDVAERSGVRLQILHLKSTYEPNWGRVPQALEMIEKAAERGLDVAFDVYPYTAGSSHLSSCLPIWAQEGGHEAILRRLRTPDARRRLLREYGPHLERYGRNLVICDAVTDEGRAVVGKSLSDIAQERDVHPLAAMLDLIIHEGNNVGVIGYSMCEADVEAALSHPLACVGSDGLAFAPYGPLAGGLPHPRSYGTFPRVLSRYSRERGLFTLEDAVRKMTSLPASRIGLRDRGRISEGHVADLVIFSETEVADLATFEDPHRYPAGIEHVLVAGEPVVEHGEHTGAGPGRVLRRAAY
jgi:N-acyl-D-amino-acid deacylase